MSACCLGLMGAVLFNFVMETTDTTSENRLKADPFVLFSAAKRTHKSTGTRILDLQIFREEDISYKKCDIYED